MKRWIIFFLVVLFLFSRKNFGQIFTQNFNSSITLTDYYSASPSTNQFTNISFSSGASASVSTNALVLSYGLSGDAYAIRNTDFATIPTGMKFQFDFSLSGNTKAASSILYVIVGSGSLVNGITLPANTNIFARFTINCTVNNGEFKIKDITNNVVGANAYTGTQTITWFLNNTSSSQIYTSPSGSLETLANDMADIWVGTTKEFTGVNVQTSTLSLARFKFNTQNPSNSENISFTIDNIVINNESVLPVELTSFTSNVIGNKVELNWRTATEVNNYGFEIEISQTSKVKSETWEKIGFVQGNGNSNSPKSYSYTDQPTGGKEFKYRLKQIDFDGSFEYSFEITAKLGNVSNYKLDQNYPNPFNPFTKISYTIPQRTYVRLRVYDMLAKEVAELVNTIQESGSYEATFDGSNLPSGAYFYKLEAGNYIEVKKILLIK